MESLEQELAETPIERIYQLLGNAISSAISEPWETASLYAEIESEESGLIYGRYKTHATATETRGFDAEEEVYYAFNELRRRLIHDGEEPWTQAHFALQANGTFNLSFTYGPIPEDHERL